MQRRAAAIYFVFFLVVGAAAYAYIGVAQDTQRPAVSLDGTTLGANETAGIDGMQYTVTELGHESSGGGGGHGGGGEGALIAEIAWTDADATYSETLDNGSTTTYQGDSYVVDVPSADDPSSFTLREALNVTAILQSDPAVENTLATKTGTDQVVYRENNSIEPLESYLPTRETISFAEGDEYTLEGNATTVAAVESGGVTLEWVGAKSRTAELEEGANVTLADGQQYFAHFPGDKAVQVVDIDQYGDYAETLAAQSYFTERKNGLWGVVILSGFGAFMILAAAYMPTRG
jgi:hypothetical protein